jgi:hypothetical protein
VSEDDARKLAVLASQQPGAASGPLIEAWTQTLLALAAVARLNGYALQLTPIDSQPSETTTGC